MAGVKVKELLFHLLGMVFFSYTLSCTLAIFIPGVTDTYGGRFKFLTFLALCLQIMYYAFSIVVDLKWFCTHRLFTQSCGAEERKLKRDMYDTIGKFSLRRLRDYIFCTLVFPITFFVPVFYWGIYCYSPMLMMPPLIRQLIEPHGFYNHAVHTAPLIFSLLELVITFHLPPSKKRKALSCVIIFGTGYIAWILWIAYHANIWVYPFLAKMTPVLMAQFFIGVYASGAIAYFVGIALSSYYWRYKLAVVWAKIEKNS